jgi:sulfur-oxidizing protein SoxY
MKFQIIRSVLIASGLAAVAFQVPASAGEAGVWPLLRAEVFKQAPIIENDGVVTLSAPDRAEDAALVPITISLPAASSAEVRKVTLLIDENPAPVAAVFTFGEPTHATIRTLETRVRVDRYSYIRAIAETSDGKLHMASHFVKASGGCSAAASKDAELALKDLGKMQITSRALDADHGLKSAMDTKIMIRHPNFSGLQIDDVTRGYRPAHFIRSIAVRQGDELLFTMEGGISIAENPHVRFVHTAMGRQAITVSADDTEGGHFTGRSVQSGS